ncbi:hypothetical protein BDF21DRAFT_394759 [Thamnidium elegans]|nr:hypothetical protein BDF21DRAFT_394759 [Thamnidium elegans]
MRFKSADKITAFVDNTCYKCERSYSSPSHLINHMANIHHIHLNPRPQSDEERPVSKKYEFTYRRLTTYQRVLFGCPSCWFYSYRNLQTLAKHIQNSHLSLIPESEQMPEYDTSLNKNVAEQDVLKMWDEISTNLKKFLGTE